VALAVAMALQELATNAVKYGALSTPEGRIAVRWSVDPTEAGPRLRLRWEEAGGPPVQPPQRRGFGSRLIERSLAQDLDGAASIEFAPGGVVCTLEALIR
jgi:two-component sensor histidine kinase